MKSRKVELTQGMLDRVARIMNAKTTSGKSKPRKHKIVTR